MIDIHEIPPEILAAAFEMGICSWGINFIHPLSLVCSAWREIIENTPRLWGIITMRKHSRPTSLTRQIAKAKASPLSIKIDSNVRFISAPQAHISKQLVSLVGNWVSVDTKTDFLAKTCWADLHRSLEGLTLTRGMPDYDDPKIFFKNATDIYTKCETKLHSLSVKDISKSWILGFLGPHIRHFHICRARSNDDPAITVFGNAITRLEVLETVDYLSRVPSAVTIELSELHHYEPSTVTLPIVRLLNLRSLRLNSVLYSAKLLSSIMAPSLQVLSIDHIKPNPFGFGWSYGQTLSNGNPFSPFFAQWSHPSYTPTNLHTLEFINSFDAGDIPYFIRWLEKLPNVVRLFLKDDNNVIRTAAESLSTDEERNLYTALGSPRTSEKGEIGWLCPSLMILYIDADLEITDLICIARVRGGVTLPKIDSVPLPKRLRRIESRLCVTSEPEKVDLLKALVDQTCCICTNCGLMLEVDDKAGEPSALELEDSEVEPIFSVFD